MRSLGVLVLLALTAACGGGDDEDALVTVTEGPVPCTRGAEPITDEAAVAALQAHGISARLDEGCPEGVAAVLTNRAPGADQGTEETRLREGHVNCFLHERPPDGAPGEVVRRGADGADAELQLANLTCAILADSPQAEDRIASLRAAFEELERQLR